jgi:hypothetical protein
MNDIPDFDEALMQFRSFLVKNGHPDEVFWVFREDLWQLSINRVLVRYPTHSENITLAQKVFAEGHVRGLIEITAVAEAANRIAASVWFPKYPNEEVQGWNRGMKLGIRQPLPRASVLASRYWWLLRLFPSFRRYQRYASFIGTRDWAAA